MLRPDPCDFQLVGDLLQAALEVFARLHEILDIVDVWKVGFELLEKVSFSLGQVLVCQQVDEVTKVVARVERKPLDLLLARLYFWTLASAGTHSSTKSRHVSDIHGDQLCKGVVSIYTQPPL